LALKAHTWLSQLPLFLDTETTGLGNQAQALETGLKDADDRVVFSTRYRLTVTLNLGHR